MNPRQVVARETSESTNPHRLQNGTVHQDVIESVRQHVAEVSWLAFRKTTVDGLAERETAAELDASITAVTQAKYRVSKLLQHAAAAHHARRPDCEEQPPTG